MSKAAPADLALPLAVVRAGRADHLELLGVWEASVRATHHFLAEADIAALKP
ncbi:hypothetical protein [Humidesulfovibrio idahonensis]